MGGSTPTDLNVARGAGAESGLSWGNSAPIGRQIVNKKQQREAAKAEKLKAKEAKEKGEAGSAIPTEEVKPKAAKEKKAAKEGAMPAMPKLPSAARARKPKPEQPCSCGCGTPTRSQWAPGHDARAKGWALRIERGIIKIGDVPANERKGAEFMLKKRKADNAANLKLVDKPAATEGDAAVNE